MLSYKEIEVPDNANFRNVSVVEILVKAGERIEVDTPLITVTSNKGTVDVPSPLAGRVQEVIVEVDDRVSQGSSIILLETEIEEPQGIDEAGFDPAAADITDTEAGPIATETAAEDTAVNQGNSETEAGITVSVPDIGDFEQVEIIEVLVREGDHVNMEDPLITLESDKATMDVPSPMAGTIKQLFVKVGDRVSEGDAIVDFGLGIEDDAAEQSEAETQVGAPFAAIEPAEPTEALAPVVALEPAEHVAAAVEETAPEQPEEEFTISVPDIGDFEEVEIIEVHVALGDTVKMEDPLITLESDKATMDVPSPMAGTIKQMFVQLGDRVSEGSAIAELGVRAAEPAPVPVARIPVEPEPAAVASEPAPAAPAAKPTRPAAAAPAPSAAVTAGPSAPPLPATTADKGKDDIPPHASPGVRRFARELGVELTQVAGGGPKGRILKEDVQQWVKRKLSEPAASSPATFTGSGIPEMPDIDFSQFGEIDKQPLSRIKKLTAANLSRAWLHVPHVTQHDEADITELEAFRQDLKKEQESKGGARITMLSFLMKACVVALKEFPNFNSSLEKGGENLIVKKYYHLGLAVDTDQGLVVPVVRDVDRKTIRDLAVELGDISSRARKRQLSPKDLQGASFTISSLGGIGGTAFTPIVNAPEVAILGVSRSSMKPVYDGGKGEFVPRLILPMSLSYDHRVIDGAQAARFTAFLSKALADVRHLLL